MTLWITLRNLRARSGATLLTILAVALATATALVVPLVTRQIERGAQDAAQVFDLLITAKGSSSQAVLSSLFYLDVPIGNVPESVYTDLRDAPGTRRAVPLAFGDTYQGAPVVGTTSAFLDQRERPQDPPYFRVAQGRVFGDHFELLAGAQIAHSANLRLGSTFAAVHGQEIDGVETEKHRETYRVVGILAPTGGPVDGALLTPIESVWEAHGQVKGQREVTAVLYAASALNELYSTAQRINAGAEAQAVFPGQVFGQLHGLLTQGEAAYAGLSVLVLILAACTVWLGVYAAGLERLRTVALLRALGASRRTVFGLVLNETLLTVLVGLLLGVGLSLLLGGVGAQVLGSRLGFRLPVPQLDAALLWRVLLLLPLGLVAALWPAVRAARVSPATHL
jgi:putative ABC transport system permease protein